MSARAIGGFANGDGGVLVLGVRTRKQDDLDVASEPRASADCSTLRDRVIGWISDALAPEHGGIEAIALTDPTAPPAGYVAVRIPSSERRPHMSMGPNQQQYFRRGATRTIPMSHGEVRDLMLAPKQADLAFVVNPLRRLSSGNFVDYNFVLGLRNDGTVPAKSPYLIVVRTGRLEVQIDDTFAGITARHRRDQNLGFYAEGLTLHVHDELDMAAFGVRFLFRLAERHRGMWSAAAHEIAATADTEMFVTGIPLALANEAPGFQKVQFDVVFGAENAPRKEASFAAAKMNLFRAVEANLIGRT